jgi:hypothetical protein
MTEIEAQLAIPPAALHDSQAFEVLRVWVAEGGQHVCLRRAVWEDPAAWGILLADLARHITNSFVQGRGDPDAGTVLNRIRAGFEAELDAPTDSPVGHLRTH